MYMKNYKMSYSYRYHIHSFLWHPFFGLCFTHCNYVRSDDVRNFKGEAHSVSTIVSDNSGIQGKLVSQVLCDCFNPSVLGK